jgi:hypothetical protein
MFILLVLNLWCLYFVHKSIVSPGVFRLFYYTSLVSDIHLVYFQTFGMISCLQGC